MLLLGALATSCAHRPPSETHGLAIDGPKGAHTGAEFCVVALESFWTFDMGSNRPVAIDRMSFEPVDAVSVRPGPGKSVCFTALKAGVVTITTESTIGHGRHEVRTYQVQVDDRAGHKSGVRPGSG